MRNWKRARISRKHLSILLTVAVTGLSGLQAVKADNIEKQINTTDLNDPTGWLDILTSSNVAPGAADIAVFDLSGTPASMGISAAVSWQGILMGSNAPALNFTQNTFALTLGTSGIDMSAATANLTISNSLILSGAQTWNVAANTVLTQVQNVAGSVALTKSGAGTLVLQGATNSTLFTGSFIQNGGLTLLTNSSALGTSTIVMNSGIIRHTSVGKVNNVFNVLGTGTLTTSSGGTYTGNFSSSSTGVLVYLADAATNQDDFTGTGGGLNQLAGFLGTLDLAQGSMRFNGASDHNLGNGVLQLDANGRMLIASTASQSVGSLQGSGTLGGSTTNGSTTSYTIGNLNTATTFSGIIMNGTANASTAAVNVHKIGTGTLTLTGTNVQTGLMDVQNGVLAFNNSAGLGNAASAATNLLVGNAANANATLRYNGANNATLNRLITLTNVATLESTGAGAVNYLNTGNLVSTASTTLILGGANTGTNTLAGAYTAGSVIKNDAGTWALSNPGNVYAGTTTVNAGKLYLTGSIGGAVSVASNATLAPGLGIANVGVTGLTLSSGSSLAYEFGLAGNDTINLLGGSGLTIGNAVTLNLLDAVTGGTYSTAGNYVLFSNVTGLTGVPTNLTIGNPVGGQSYSLSLSGSNIILAISGGAVANAWKTNGGGSWGNLNNWTDHVPNAVGETANFGGSLTSGTGVVTLDGSKTVSAVLFNSAGGSYDIQSGTGGSLILDNGTSTTNINELAGAHKISAPITLNSPVTIAVNGSSLTLGGDISGVTGNDVTITGSGVLFVLANNDYAGNTGISGASNVQLGNGSPAALGTGTVTNFGNLAVNSGGSVPTLLNSGVASFNAGSTGSNVTNAGSLTVTGGSIATLTNSGTATLNAGGTLTSVNNSGALIYNDGVLTGAITNTGITTFNKTGTYSMGAAFSGAGTMTFAGLANITVTAANTATGPTNINAGSITLGSGAALSNGALTMAASTALTLNGSASFGALSGVGNIFSSGTSTLTLSQAGASTFTGNILNPGGGLTILKTGAGALTLGGIGNNFSGDFQINSGTINVTTNNALGGARIILNAGNSSPIVLSDTVNFPNNLLILNTSASATNLFNVATTTGLATWSGNLTFADPATTSNQLRMGIIQGTLTFTGTTTVPASYTAATGGTIIPIIMFDRGNIVLAGNYVLNTAVETWFGRSAGNSSTVTMNGNAQIINSVAAGTEGANFGGSTNQTTSSATLIMNGNSYMAVGRVGSADGGAFFNINNGGANTVTTLSLNGSSSIALAGFTKVSAAATTINLNGGMIIAGASNTNFLPVLPSTTVNVLAGGAKFNTNGFAITVAAPLVSNGTDGGLSKSGAGTLTLTQNLTTTGSISVSAGKMVLSHTTAARQSAGVLIETSGLSLTGSAQLDITNHDLLIHNATYASVFAKIASGYNFGLWNGPGILTSEADAAGGTTMLGVLQGSDYDNFNAPVFDGRPVVATDVVVKYTYWGDLTLDGQVNGDDLGNFLNFYDGTGGPGVGNYIDGDMNFDGLINGDDLGNFLNNYTAAPAPAPLGGGFGSLGLAAVPEPASLMLLGLGASALLTRRRRKA